jgi:hypothetical protein
VATYGAWVSARRPGPATLYFVSVVILIVAVVLSYSSR